MATEVLGITEITDSQAAKYATHNEGLRQLEGRMVRVVSRTVTAQPSGVEGATYIIPTGATGANWASQDGKLGHFYGGTWKFWTPTEGARVWVNDEDVRLVYNSSAWVLDTKLPMLTKSVAGASNVTLTEAESRYPAIDCTGAITANIALIVTTTPKLLIVKNSTTGAFTLTVKTSAGTGVIVSQGTRALVYCDGTDVVSIAGAAGNPQGDRKESVRVATTANITLSGTQTIDGVAVVAGDRVLVKNQTTGSENGIYVCAAGAWARAADANTSDKVTAGMFTVVTEGGVAPDTLWVLTTNDPITLGTTALAFAQLSGGGGGTFLALTDTPSAYTGAGLQFVRVNAGATALEFATPSGSGNVSGPVSGTSTNTGLARWDGTTGTLLKDSATYLLSDSGTLNAQDNVLQRPEIMDYAETRTAPTISAGTLTLDLTTGNVFEVSLNANVTTLTLSNPPATGKAGSLTLILKQDATGGRTFAWPASVKGGGGTKPTISSAANAIDIYSLLTTDAGTSWYVFTGGQAFS